MLRMLARFVVVVCALWASQALALGLGDINVKSKLNQPFSASVAILGATSAQLDSLTVKLASADEFNRAGIERSDYLSTLKFEVQDVPGGARLVISSEQIAREPFLNFIVVANSPDGKLLREYTVLLDPPTLTNSSAPAVSPAAASTSSYVPPPAPVVQVPATAAPSIAPAEAAQLATQSAAARHGKGKHPPTAEAVAAAPPPAAAPAPAPQPVADTAPVGGSTYGPTAPQETLWSIATKLRPGPQVSMDQVLLALYRANPQAFDRGSFNGLLKGQTLKVPSQADMQEASAEQAKVAVDAWRHGSRPASLKKNPETNSSAATPAPAKAAKPVRAKPAKPVAAEKAESVPPPAPVAAAPVPVAAAPAAASAPIPAQKPATPPPPPAPAAPAAASPEKPAAAETSAPAAAAPAPSATPAASANTPPASPAEPPKKKLVSAPPPPPEPSLFDDPMTLVGIGVFALILVAFGVLIFRRKAPPMPDFRAKAPPVPAKAPPPKAPPLGKGPVLAPPAKPAPAGPPPLPPKAQPAPAKLGDTTALPDEKPPVAPPKPVFAADRTTLSSEPLLARTSLDDTAQLKAAETALSASVFDQTSQTKAAPVGGGDVDFDLTSQFEAQTLSINLDANDPLSEADFHLAYGLYDEAASLLKQALVKEPQRQDLRQKLAETYFAGGKPLEFQETAEALHGQISPTEWQKIAIMGRQLCPDSSLFKSDGSTPAPDIDLSLGDSIGPAPAQVLGTTPSRPAAAHGNVIDFDLDAELNKAAPAPAVAATAAPAAAAEKPDFDLSHFDFSGEPAHPVGHENTVEFNLDELDLSKATLGGVDDLDLHKSGSGGISSGDEIGTKLDLARVYADMGDNDAARGLLGEVLSTGNAGQKGEAEALIKRLSA